MRRHPDLSAAVGVARAVALGLLLWAGIYFAGRWAGWL